jgi:hypothetical protein
MIPLLNFGGRWNLLFTEIQNIKHIDGFFKKGKIPSLLAFKRIEPLDKNSQRYTFTQFPINRGVDKRGNKKVFSATLTRTKNEITLSDLEQSENLYLNFKDKFLLYRILDPHTKDGLVEMTKGFLKERGLESFNIDIITNSTKVAKNGDAHFSNVNKEICYRPGFTKEYVLYIVETVRHEIEHAWQHFMIGRIGKGWSNFETEAYEKFGYPKIPSYVEEAEKLAIARDKYPKLTENEDLSKNIDYMTNYMEIKATEAGEKTAKEYKKAKDNFIFFEQFD